MDFDSDEEIVGEGPCEFCGELFPLMLLIEHESIHLVEDNFQYVEENINNAVPQSVTELEKREVIEEKHLKSATGSQIINEVKEKCYADKNEFKIAVEEKAKNIDVIHNKVENEKIKEFTTDKGEKLLVYGNDIDPDKDLDNEKQMYKMPNNPLLNNLCKEKDIENINNLSDDDDNESLEEFWKRARDALKRNRIRNECA